VTGALAMFTNYSIDKNITKCIISPFSQGAFLDDKLETEWESGA
jgi:hypothetical protein